MSNKNKVQFCESRQQQRQQLQQQISHVHTNILWIGIATAKTTVRRKTERTKKKLERSIYYLRHEMKHEINWNWQIGIDLGMWSNHIFSKNWSMFLMNVEIRRFVVYKQRYLIRALWFVYLCKCFEAGVSFVFFGSVRTHVNNSF